MIEVTSPQQLESEVLSADMAVLDFWAPWCSPCKALAPLLERLADHNPNLVVAKVNVDEQKELAKAAGIRSIPTLAFLRKGQAVKTLTGLQSISTMPEAVDSLK